MKTRKGIPSKAVKVKRSEINFARNLLFIFGAVFLLAAGFTGASYAGLFGNSETLLYRVTASVETPEGIKTGSAVCEASHYYETSFFPGQGGTSYNIVKGEAVVVDLGKRGILFALNGHNEIRPVSQLFRDKAKKSKITLAIEDYPIFVRFRDLNDPKTIENVRSADEIEKIRQEDPKRPLISFKDAFGIGVNVKEVTIEVAFDPVTDMIEKYLPWVSMIGGGNLGGGKFNGEEWYERLSRSEFKKGF